MRVPVADGVHFNVEVAGQTQTSGLPLVLLHGFTGSAANWRTSTVVFSQQFTTVAIDLLGHGDSDSPEDPARYRIEHCIEDLIAIWDQLKLEQVNLLGYSMGGRVALSLAAAHPNRVGKLILESASPGLADSAERAARVTSDEALATRIEQEGLEAFVDYWQDLPLFASQLRLSASIRADLRTQRLRNNPRGLANSLRGLGTGAQPSLWSRLNAITTPMLLITGSLDQKFTNMALDMANSIPSAQIAIVPDAGHTLHLEQPAEFERLVLEFLNH